MSEAYRISYDPRVEQINGTQFIPPQPKRIEVDPNKDCGPFVGEVRSSLFVKLGIRLGYYLCVIENQIYVLLWDFRCNTIYFCGRYFPFDDGKRIWDERLLTPINVVCERDMSFGGYNSPLTSIPTAFNLPDGKLIYVAKGKKAQKMTDNDGVVKLEFTSHYFGYVTNETHTVDTFVTQLRGSDNNRYIIFHNSAVNIGWFMFKDLSLAETWCLISDIR